MQRLLPAGFTEETVSEAIRAAEFEPSIEEVLENTTVRLIESQVMQAVLESIVSEHAMRMLAMKSATDNANTLIDDLSLAYNNARQAAITQELAEITGGSEAMK
jgi:F-type H+-transporting ATPase subunit gamma